MKLLIIVFVLPMVLSGCLYSHTKHYQCTDSDNRPYRLIDNDGTWCFETRLSLEYERHFFTKKAGFGYCCMNPIEMLIQIPCIILTELPFRWMWEKEYAYRVPVEYDKPLKVTRHGGHRCKFLAWDDRHSGISNIVCATRKVLDENTGSSEISVVYSKGGVKIREVELEPVFGCFYELWTFDGRHVYIWDDFDRASYLYGYFRCGLAAKTSWCPILLELDLKTGIVRRLVWTEYNTLYHSDDVILERRK